MGKIIDITPTAMDIRPILMIRTAHRMDAFLLCVKCLELYTDLTRFKTVYVLADDVGDEHAVIIKAFQKRHRNVIDVHVSRKSGSPGVAAMQNFILKRHTGDVIITLSDDVFVTPFWLEQMIGSYKLHKQYDEVAAVSCLAPISRIGKQCMDRALRNYYPEERLRLPDQPIEKNGVYHRFIWEKILFDKLVEKYFELEKPKHHYTGFVFDDCLLFDSRLTRRILPLPPEESEQNGGRHINAVMKAERLKSAIIAEAIVHHYAYPDAEDYLRRHILLDDVWWYMTCLDESPAYLKRRSRGVISFERFKRPAAGAERPEFPRGL